MNTDFNKDVSNPADQIPVKKIDFPTTNILKIYGDVS